MSPAVPSRRRRSRRVRPALSVVVLLTVLAAACSGAGDGPADGADPSVGATAPATAPTQAGSQEKATVVLDLSGDTMLEAPISGLIAIALSPDGSRLFTLSDTMDRSLTLRVFPYEPDTRLSSADGKVLMRIPHPFVHSGGGLVVAPEGDVFVAVGAFESAGQPRGPQNPDGVVIRVPAAAVEAGTVFTPGDGDLVARGLRNPWRMSQDPDTGDLWIGDVGDGTAEEINRVPASMLASGEVPNFGFPYVEGDSPVLTPAPPLRFTAPTWFHGRADTEANSIIGGVVYRGTEHAELSDRYLFSDFTERVVRALDPATDQPDGPAEPVANLPAGPTSFAVDSSGEVLVLTIDGEVYRLVRSDSDVEPPFIAERVLSVGTGRLSGPEAEATSLAVLPDGSGVLGAFRGGQITRSRFAPEDGELCELDFDQLPQRPVGGSLQDYVESTLAAVQRYGDSLPERLQPERRTMTELFERAARLGADEGWDSPELERLLAEAALERGDFADAQRAESKIANHVATVCG